LSVAKDKQTKDARWVDIELKDKKLDWFRFDLWKNKVKFKAAKDIKFCPHCQTPLNKVDYGDSNVEVDVCGICKGIWVERDEFKKIIKYIKNEAGYEVLNNYAKNLISETKEIFIGPESIQSEVADLLVLTKLLKYKLVTQYPTLVKIFLNMPLTK